MFEFVYDVVDGWLCDVECMCCIVNGVMFGDCEKCIELFEFYG